MDPVWTLYTSYQAEIHPIYGFDPPSFTEVLSQFPSPLPPPNQARKDDQIEQKPQRHTASAGKDVERVEGAAEKWTFEILRGFHKATKAKTATARNHAELMTLFSISPINRINSIGRRIRYPYTKSGNGP